MAYADQIAEVDRLHSNFVGIQARRDQVTLDQVVVRDARPENKRSSAYDAALPSTRHGWNSITIINSLIYNAP